MGTPWNCRYSRNCLRLLDEVVRRLLAVDASTTDGRHRCIERLSSLALAPYTARGTGYAVWTGIGAAGTAILGMAVLGDSVAPMRVLCIGCILAGVIGLKVASGN
jgi:Small Multidrug Resistance protein